MPQVCSSSMFASSSVLSLEEKPLTESGAVSNTDPLHSYKVLAADTFAVAAASGRGEEQPGAPSEVIAAAAAAKAAGSTREVAVFPTASENLVPSASLLFSAATLTANCLNSTCNAMAAAVLGLPPSCGVKVRRPRPVLLIPVLCSSSSTAHNRLQVSIKLLLSH